MNNVGEWSKEKNNEIRWKNMKENILRKNWNGLMIFKMKKWKILEKRWNENINGWNVKQKKENSTKKKIRMRNGIP